MAFPVTVTPEVAFGDDPYTIAPTWTDLSELIESAEVDRGRSSPLEPFGSGSATVFLRDAAGDLDPDNASSPYYSGSTQVLPNRQFRLTVADTDEYAAEFTGTSTTDPGTFTTPTTMATFWQYAGVWGRSSGELYLPTNDGPSFLLLDMGEADGWVQFDLGAGVAAENGQGVVFRMADPSNYWILHRDTTAGDWQLDKVVDGTPTNVGNIAGTGVAGTRVRIDYNADTVGPVTIDGTPVGSSSFTDDHAILATVCGVYAASGVTSSARWDRWRSGVDQRTLFRGLIDPFTGWRHLHGDSGVMVKASDLFSAVEDYRIAAVAAAVGAGELAGARVNRVLDAVGIPEEWREVEPGITVFQGTTWDVSGREALQLSALSEGGQCFVAANGRVVFYGRHASIRRPRITTGIYTLSDDGSDNDYETRRLERAYATILFHTARVAAIGGDVQEVTDATAETDYRGGTYDRSGLYMRDDPEAYARAEWVLAQFKDPTSSPAAVHLNGAFDADREVAIRTELCDRMIVEYTPRGVSQASKPVLVERISHRISGQAWDTVLGVSTGDRFGFADWETFLRFDVSGHQWKDSAPFKVYAF